MDLLLNIEGAGDDSLIDPEKSQATNLTSTTAKTNRSRNFSTVLDTERSINADESSFLTKLSRNLRIVIKSFLTSSGRNEKFELASSNFLFKEKLIFYLFLCNI